MVGFNEEFYGLLLREYLPRIITSEQENEKALSQIEKLMFKENRTSEEDTLYLLLVHLVEAYEESEYHIESTSPHEALKHLMVEQRLRKKDLEDIIGSQETVSEIINGKRRISTDQAKNLAALFGVSPAVFI
ncbi:type II toxin-antitoxin system HigA family antitoxin [Gloeocapsa sp. PCC 73106]|uniref:helix-turn-helix domain-containing protein n=1 Tax=Gloeocapsa sp. PCC 73106 TaxID=102232 RepID=UPI0002ACEBCE|nr:helix-turn-helix domain-containing protein [Gloeocapsa sp. PCC 73106]ELR97754.1 putative transcription regulator containing HTH domain [Gloeocapsa sp. PCC 73106]